MALKWRKPLHIFDSISATSLGLCFAGIWTIQFLIYKVIQRYQLHQHVYALSPSEHQAKQKTPSLGGIGIVLSVIFAASIFNIWTAKILWLLGLTASFAIIGLIDDISAYFKEENKGISAKQKSMAQVLIAALFLGLFSHYFHTLVFWEILFFIFIIVGTSNATNLSDGLDGLLGSLSLLTFTGFYILIASTQINELTSICLLFGLSCVAFLTLNWHPAKLFMGDTGSLSLGAAMAGIAILIDHPWALLSFGAVYILETLSVIVQVLVYKWKKERVFLMAPLHHHFECMGWSEIKVVLLFWSIAASFLMFYLVRL